MTMKICIPVREGYMICCQLQFTLWSLDTTHRRSWSQEFTTVLVYGIIIVYPIIVWRGYTCHATRQNTRVTRRKDRCWLVCKKWENCVRRIETATQSCNHSTETSWASRCRGPRSQLTGAETLRTAMSYSNMKQQPPNTRHTGLAWFNIINVNLCFVLWPC